MKLFKRNAIILTVAMFVCAAVYLNWSYGRDELALDAMDPDDGEIMSEELREAGLCYSGEAEETELSASASDYFAAARLTRTQARDSAIGLLRESAELENVSQESKDKAMDEISVMAAWSLDEAQLENIIKAKGFSECVVFLDADSATVTLPAPAEGLSAAGVSRITDIIVSETSLTPEQIKIIEVK